LGCAPTETKKNLGTMEPKKPCLHFWAGGWRKRGKERENQKRKKRKRKKKKERENKRRRKRESKIKKDKTLRNRGYENANY